MSGFGPFLTAALFLPLLGALAIAAFGRRSERITAAVAGLVVWLGGALTAAALAIWAWEGAGAREVSLGELYRNGDYRFPLVLYVDATAAVFLAGTVFLTAVIVKYCRYYLHREAGYARFFVTILTFSFGMKLLVLAGTMDLLFAGWEFVGIASFLLIAFYRDRVAPVRNAFRAYLVYRLCDVGVLLGAWMGHLIWHRSQHFADLAVSGGLAGADPGSLLGLSFLILLAACGKSAQFPFSGWLPRAMEGPTPSSAIFYGALSIHAGVFLLLRTFPIWYSAAPSRAAVGVVGVLSAVLATLTGRTESNIKGQIGYASITQVGLMLVELALGWRTLVLFHFVANASLRCYQLLVSPSVVAHLLRIQGAAGRGLAVSDWSIERRLPRRLRSTLYVLVVQESYVPLLLHRCLWKPLRGLSRQAARLDGPLGWSALLVLALAFAGVRGPVVTVAMVLASLGALAPEAAPGSVWNRVGLSAALGGALVGLVAPEAGRDIVVHLSGVLPAWAFGRLALRRLVPSEGWDLRLYYGLVERRPGASLALFLCFLALTGFPIGPAFLGEDLVLHHLVGRNLWMAWAFTAAFVLNGIALARLYVHLCLGPPVMPSAAAR